MIRVGIIGATGYGGRELLRLLLMHPAVEVVSVVSSTSAGKRVAEVLPAFARVTDLCFEPFDPAESAQRCDVVFVAVPSKESMVPVRELRRVGVRVIDLGPDFRLKDVNAFRAYYKTEHIAPELLSEVVYGLPPFYRDALRTASLVAVPGCYPVTVILALRPLLSAPLEPIPVVVNSISGVSGAGRTLNEVYHFPEMNENVRAYRLAVHQHIPEMEQELGHALQVQFTPHVGPYTRGILSTIVVRMKEPFDPQPYYNAYASEPFVRVFPEGTIPDLRQVRGSNFCDLGWVRDDRTGNLLIVSAIDNLIGGTAGLALQCFNLMFDIEETVGLRMGGITP